MIVTFFWINRRLLTLLVIDVQYVEQLKENVTGIHRVQIVLKEIKNVFIPMLTKKETLFNRVYYQFREYKSTITTKSRV